MGAITPTTVARESAGSNTLLICTFSAIADTDTYASGLSTNPVAYWANSTANSTGGNEGFNVALSLGTFTFYAGESMAGKLYILTKG